MEEIPYATIAKIAAATLLPLLYWLRRREQQKKAIDEMDEIQHQGYLPIEAEPNPDPVKGFVDYAPRIWTVVWFSMICFVLVVLYFVTPAIPYARGIVVGTGALMAMIIVLWRMKEKRS